MLFLGANALSRPAHADDTQPQTPVPRAATEDVHVPSLAEEAETFVLPLSEEPGDLATFDAMLSAFETASFSSLNWGGGRTSFPGDRRVNLTKVGAVSFLGGSEVRVREDEPGAQAVGQTPIVFGRFQVQQFHVFQGSLENLSFHAEGNPDNPDPKKREVQVIYTDPRTNKQITLTAARVDYDDATRKVTAVGFGTVQPNGTLEHPITLVREDGTFTGNRIEYDFDDRVGIIEHAVLESEYFRLSGEKIQANKDGSISVVRGRFTTCDQRKPHYEIAAGSLTVFPNRYVVARNIVVSLGDVRLIPIPEYRRNLNVRSQIAGLPQPGYNRRDGLTLHLADSPLLSTHSTFDYDLSLTFRRLPTGFLLYQHDLSPTPNDVLPPRGVLPLLGDPLRGILESISPPTWRDYAESRTLEPYPHRITLFAILQNEQFIYNRQRTDLSLSRYPEVGIRYANVLGHRPPPPTPLVPPQTSLLQRVPNAPVLLDIYASAGVLREQPTNVVDGRLATRVDLASQPLPIGKRLAFRAGLSNWLNFYSDGSAYNLISPSVEVDYIPTSTSVFNVAYRYANDTGTTPFTTDRRDIRHELRLQYEVGGPIAFSVVGKYDLERSRAYDAEFAIVRNLDCLQYGITYRVHSQQFAFIFNFLPPGRARNTTK